MSQWVRVLSKSHLVLSVFFYFLRIHREIFNGSASNGHIVKNGHHTHVVRNTLHQSTIAPGYSNTNSFGALRHMVADMSMQGVFCRACTLVLMYPKVLTNSCLAIARCIDHGLQSGV